MVQANHEGLADLERLPPTGPGYSHDRRFSDRASR